MQGKQRFWLAGPFTHTSQAEAKQALFECFSVDGCPVEFITQHQTDYRDGFLMIALTSEVRRTWFENCRTELISKNLF
jgi:hypothetical protein